MTSSTTSLKKYTPDELMALPRQIYEAHKKAVLEHAAAVARANIPSPTKGK